MSGCRVDISYVAVAIAKDIDCVVTTGGQGLNGEGTEDCQDANAPAESHA